MHPRRLNKSRESTLHPINADLDRTVLLRAAKHSCPAVVERCPVPAEIRQTEEMSVKTADLIGHFGRDAPPESKATTDESE
jgi:hypothetical protein